MPRRLHYEIYRPLYPRNQYRSAPVRIGFQITPCTESLTSTGSSARSRILPGHSFESQSDHIGSAPESARHNAERRFFFPQRSGLRNLSAPPLSSVHLAQTCISGSHLRDGGKLHQLHFGTENPNESRRHLHHRAGHTTRCQCVFG